MDENNATIVLDFIDENWVMFEKFCKQYNMGNADADEIRDDIAKAANMD